MMDTSITAIFVSLVTTLVTSCTIHVIDDTNDYDIEAVITTPECDVAIVRSESRRQRKAEAKQ